jgi:hypothetical protein
MYRPRSLVVYSSRSSIKTGARQAKQPLVIFRSRSSSSSTTTTRHQQQPQFSHNSRSSIASVLACAASKCPPRPPLLRPFNLLLICDCELARDQPTAKSAIWRVALLRQKPWTWTVEHLPHQIYDSDWRSGDLDRTKAWKTLLAEREVGAERKSGDAVENRKLGAGSWELGAGRWLVVSKMAPRLELG